MEGKKTEDLQYSALKDLNAELNVKVSSLEAENKKLQDQITNSEKYKEEFFEARKGKIIEGAVKLVPEDKKVDFEAKLNKYKNLDFDAFEGLVHEFLAIYRKEVPKGLETGISTAETRKDDKLPEEQKIWGEYRNNKQKFDDTYAKKTMGGK